jgi:hypothetical protein
MALSTSARRAKKASPDSRPDSRPIDPEPLKRLGLYLYNGIRTGESAAIAALTRMSPKQVRRQLVDPGTPMSARLLLVLLAFYQRSDAVRLYEDTFDAVRVEILPTVRETQNLSLFGGSR